jgi:hypothetical protein
MPSDPYPEGKPQRTEFGSLMTQVLTEIVRPYLAGLIRGDDTITNKSTLHAAFKKATGSTVSFSTFNGWLDTLGISFRKTVQIEGLNVSPVPAPGGAVGPRPDAGEDEVRFDNESPMEFRRPMGFGDAFGEIARQIGNA